MLTAHIRDGHVRWTGTLPKGTRSVHVQYLVGGEWQQITALAQSRALVVAMIEKGPHRHAAYRLIPCGGTLAQAVEEEVVERATPARRGASNRTPTKGRGKGNR